MDLVVAGEPVRLLPERALWWPAARTLVVADLHWGKTDTFHAFGIPVPGEVLADDLARLARAMDRTDAARVLVLGDLVHGRLLPTTVEAVAAWRARRPARLTLVRGNHDRHAPVLPPAWAVEEVDGALREGPFAFVHAPAPGEAYTWAGHLHPVVTLRGRADGLRLPCFHVGARAGVLPAFSAFTGGAAVRAAPGDRLYAIAEDTVVELPPNPAPARRPGRRGG